ncbi:hypothetical protein S40288_08794 [Stachybotrys chartarum IBT 40288]|nr:hypothetical protein S40288_08794 [Stachybotrys chartarum IBT 40288]
MNSLNRSKQDASNNFSVQYFDQDGDKPTAVGSEDTLLSPEIAEHALGQAFRLGEMKHMLQTREERDALQQVINQVGVDWKNIKTEEDIAQAKAKMRAYTASIDAEIEKAKSELPKELRDQITLEMSGLNLEDEQDVMSAPAGIPQIPLQAWTLNQRRKISKLNSVIRHVSPKLRSGTGLTKKLVLTVYKSYQQARLALAHGWSNVPLDVWDFFWKVFSADESINLHRLAHVSLLAKDMSEAKVTLTPAQQLLTIEAVFVEGWDVRAIDNWKRCTSTLGQESSESFQDFWELGVRMYCRIGDMAQAERAVAKLLENHSDPRILLPIIRTYSEKDTEQDREKAWSAYRRMRELLGQNITIEDYDQVISYFLPTNQIENALYAFVDMMSDGQINLKEQKYLPSVVANKFFLGKWLKRLIGAGDLDGAYEVSEFMRQKGVAAAAIHLNGLIGAWQRTGGADNVDKADELAWSMIEARVQFVRARSQGNAAALEKNEPRGTAPLPRATLETFSLLAENYRVRGLHSRLESLWEAFRDAEISPDIFMMNQLLESYINAGQYNEALELYASLPGRGVAPDPYTFSALWKTIAINRLHIVPPAALETEAVATRSLFAEMVKFKEAFAPEGMDGQLGRKILHSFRRLKDQPGFLVALIALKEVFNFLPSETLVLEILLGTTKISWELDTHKRRLMTVKKDMDREILAWAGGDVEKLEGRQRGEALYEYLQKKFWPSSESEEDVQEVLVDVAAQMGVHELLAPTKKKAKRRFFIF